MTSVSISTRELLYTPLKNRFSATIAVKSEHLFDNVQRAVHLNQQNRGLDRMPSVEKNRLSRKKYEKHLLISS